MLELSQTSKLSLVAIFVIKFEYVLFTFTKFNTSIFIRGNGSMVL